MFRPGELDQRVTVQRQTLTQDGIGGDTLAWVDQGAYWCHVRPLSGRESTGFDQLQGESAYMFVFRNGISLLDSDRLDWQGDQYNITLRKQPKSRALYIEVTAERGVAQ